MKKVFIDGNTGTTGLNIRRRLSERNDVELILLRDEKRHDVDSRLDAVERADAAFLCLPDKEAKEIAQRAGDLGTTIIDTSTAHRTADGWTYGFPELPGARAKIASSKRIANPGCHASGFIALIEPLIRFGVVDASMPFSCLSITGYSGGGKKMIAAYEDEDQPDEQKSAGFYAIAQKHKHLNEMVNFTGLQTIPTFMPVVDNYFSGMQTMIPLHSSMVRASKSEIESIYRECYHGKIVRFVEIDDETTTIYSNKNAGKDSMNVFITGNDERFVLGALYDNLGKGACGAAIQNMNIAFGLPEETGLKL